MLKSVAPLKQYGLQAAMNDGNPEAAVMFKGSLELIHPLLIGLLGPIYVPHIDVTIGADGAHVHALLSTHMHAAHTHKPTYPCAYDVPCACTAQVGWPNLACFVP